MKKPLAIVHSHADQSSITFINWVLSNVCNYACSYCPDRLHDGTRKCPSSEEVIGLAAKIVAHYRSLGKKSYFKFSGGEPAVYKGMLEVLAQLKQMGALTALNSNGSRELEWWERAIPLLDGIVLTYHIEFAELDHFSAVIERLLAAGVPTHINVPMLPDRFEQSAAHAAELASRCKGMSVALKPLLVNFDSELYPYSEAQKKAMREFAVPSRHGTTYRGAMRCIYEDGASEVLSPQTLLLRGENRWSSWNCNAGIEALSIRADGLIHRAVCRQDGPIGNLRDQSIAFPDKPVRCTHASCHCLSDIRISKWRGPDALEDILTAGEKP